MRKIKKRHQLKAIFITITTLCLFAGIVFSEETLRVPMNNYYPQKTLRDNRLQESIIEDPKKLSQGPILMCVSGCFFNRSHYGFDLSYSKDEAESNGFHWSGRCGDAEIHFTHNLLNERTIEIKSDVRKLFGYDKAFYITLAYNLDQRKWEVMRTHMEIQEATPLGCELLKTYIGIEDETSLGWFESREQSYPLTDQMKKNATELMVHVLSRIVHGPLSENESRFFDEDLRVIETRHFLIFLRDADKAFGLRENIDLPVYRHSRVDI